MVGSQVSEERRLKALKILVDKELLASVDSATKSYHLTSGGELRFGALSARFNGLHFFPMEILILRYHWRTAVAKHRRPRATQLHWPEKCSCVAIM